MNSSSVGIDFTSREALLLNAFELHKVDGQPGIRRNGIFRPGRTDVRNQRAVLALIDEGCSMGELEAQYIELVGKNSEKILRDMHKSRSAERKKAFSTILQNLLGMPEHKDKVMAYLISNLDEYKDFSLGFLGGGVMKKYITDSPDKYPPYSIFKDLLKWGLGGPISNLCRNASGLLMCSQDLDTLILVESDAEGFLMNAIANKDKEAIEVLMTSGVFLRYLPRQHALTLIGQSIADYPHLNLAQSLGGLLKTRDSTTVMPEVKRLIQAKDSPVSSFEDLLWPQIPALTVSHLVAYAMLSTGNEASARNMLVACHQKGLSLHLGLIEARDGFGAAMDMHLSEVSAHEQAVQLIDGFIWFSAKGISSAQISPLLLSVPGELLAGHSEGVTLLLARYRLTGEKYLLKLGSHQLRGLVLEDELGL